MARSKIVHAITVLYTMTLTKNYVQGADPINNAGRASPSAGTVIEIHNDEEFNEKMANHDGKLVVVDFTASWCGPCRTMAPYFKELASKYLDATFLKVDIDECPNAAEVHDIQSMPRFICYRDTKRIDLVIGARKDALDIMIRKQIAQEEGGTNLTATLVDKNRSECVNCASNRDNERFIKFLENANTHLESDSDDPRLVMSITFTQTVKLHSLKIKAPESNGPKTIKLYVNQTSTIDFEDVEGDNVISPKQTLELKLDDLNGKPMLLIGAKFPQVSNLQIFIESNQSAPGTEATRIDNLVIIGSSI